MSRDRSVNTSRRKLIVAGIASAAAIASTGYASTITFNGVAPQLTVLDVGLGRRVAFIADLHIHWRGGSKKFNI